MPFRPAVYRTAAQVHASARAREAAVKAYDQRRGSSSMRGYDWRWRRYALDFLAAHPLCAGVGCTRPAEHVDHITPVKGPDDPLFWEPSNHQPLCHSCHSRKTHREDRSRTRRQKI